MPPHRSRDCANYCAACSRPLDLFGRCRRRTCPIFGPLWAGDWGSVFFRNLEAHATPLALLSVTPPGVAEGLVWDESICWHLGPHTHSGRRGCRVVAEVADRWNQQAEASWSRLHQAAMARVRRRFGSGSVLVAKAWEPQARGPLHLHAALVYSPGREMAMTDAYVAAVRELVPRHGFGFVDLSKPKANAHALSAAAYLSKYIGKSISETAAQARRPAYVSRRLTMQTGVTMRAMRWKRFFRAAWGFDLTHAECGGLFRLAVAFPGLEPLELAAAARAP